MEVQPNLKHGNPSILDYSDAANSSLQICIQNCIECALFCEQMVQHCLRAGGMHADASHIRLMQDCSEICRVAADFMVRESNFHSRVCEACAHVCLACAIDCDRFSDDEMMKSCAALCRRTGESCQSMSQQH